MLTLLWFGQDLRLTDNPALTAAIARGGEVIPVFVLDDLDAGEWAPGGASRWWLHGSLRALDDSLRQRGNKLVLRRGPAEIVINRLLDETGADAVYWKLRYEPWATARGERLKLTLRKRSIEVRSFNSALIREPWTVTPGKGEPYRVFTPFWKALRETGISEPAAAAAARIPGPATAFESEPLSSWALRPTAPDWAGGMQAMWTSGEAAARARLEEFAAGAASDYRDKRNMPGVAGTSRLSPHLHVGEIGPRQIWRTVTAQAVANTGNPMPAGVETYLSQIAWREFSYHLLFHFPTLPEAPLRQEFARFPWEENAKGLSAWRRGLTGYPIVDAGMRELWKSGWCTRRGRPGR